MNMAAETKELAFPDYWNSRYEALKESTEGTAAAASQSYDWFRSFDQIKHFLYQKLPPPANNADILHLGCGNSVRRL